MYNYIDGLVFDNQVMCKRMMTFNDLTIDMQVTRMSFHDVFSKVSYHLYIYVYVFLSI